MRAIMMSIKPKWCELIASGNKTIEVRKTKPKLETPFKVYIYCTADDDNIKGLLTKSNNGKIYITLRRFCQALVNTEYKILNRKVIGEFVCDYIETFGDDAIHSFSNEEYSQWNDFDLNRACIHPQDFEEYANDSLRLYGWHISNLVIYDEPKKMSEFCKAGFEDDYTRWEDLHTIGVHGVGCVIYPKEPKIEDYRIKRPPQSWRYVEEMEG